MNRQELISSNPDQSIAGIGLMETSFQLMEKMGTENFNKLAEKYIKKNFGKWDKEDESKPKLRKAIKHIAHKNAKLIGEFKTKHPDYCKSASNISTQYNSMVIEAMGGIGTNDLCNENKIIKRISKEILVEKE